jgi:hypothetical protein
MFKWLKGRQAIASAPAKLTTTDVPKIMQQYGALLEKYPTAYVDETWLPVPKEQMRLVFKAAWKMAPTAQLRNYVEVGWTCLSMFQPGVGKTPVDGAVPSDASPQSLMAQLSRFVEFGKRAQAEAERDLIEMRAFVRHN